MLDVCFVPIADSCTAAKSHSITSSARASSEDGTVSAGAFAVLRLIGNSYLLGERFVRDDSYFCFLMLITTQPVGSYLQSVTAAAVLLEALHASGHRYAHSAGGPTQRHAFARTGRPSAYGNNKRAGQSRPGTSKKSRSTLPLPGSPGYESGTDHRMLPIRWILPIVGALFALALAPLAFNRQDTSQSPRDDSIASIERPEPRQTIVPAGIQRIDDRLISSRNPDTADDATGTVQATTPVQAAAAPKTPPKSTRQVHRRSRTVVHQRVKRAKVANIFGGQQARRTPKPDWRLNVVN
jgi:hypothetical protein